MLKRRSWLGLALAAVVPAGHRAQAQDGMVVFAAASLKNALDEIAAAWAKETGKPAPKISYAASSALAKQIEQGAPADLFISADLDWMDYLAEQEPDQGRHPRQPAGQQDRADRAQGFQGHRRRSSKGFDLAKALGGGRLAMANVDVGAGRQVRQGGAREARRLGRRRRTSVAQAENVRAALLLVARGEAPLGIVYATDAAAEPNVRIVGTFPEDTHPPIIYPAALTKDAKNADAKAFLDFLRSAKARTAFEKQGFTVLVKSAAAT